MARRRQSFPTPHGSSCDDFNFSTRLRQWWGGLFPPLGCAKTYLQLAKPEMQTQGAARWE